MSTMSAPGRLDFMGGVADYSGSLVLQIPITGRTHVTIKVLQESMIKITSETVESLLVYPMDDIRPTFSVQDGQSTSLLARLGDLSTIQKLFDQLQMPSWIRYILGCLSVFCRFTSWSPPSGLSFHVKSTVPISMGVSSSAAIEVATLRALEQLSGRTCGNGTELARLGQQVENYIVGAPCGLMDQLASAHGKPGQILPILNRPDILQETISLPRDIVVVGWPSGVKHSVGGSPYGVARVAAFMGKKILETTLGQKWKYTSEINPALLKENRESLPVKMTGKEFLATYGSVDDPVSQILSTQEYPVRDAVTFPIRENHRTNMSAALLRNLSNISNEKQIQETLMLVGEMMLQSHGGYTKMGLGSCEVDQMITLLVGSVRFSNAKDFIPPAHPLIYGARVGGGGSGGTVSILAHKNALPAIHRLKNNHLTSKTLPIIAAMAFPSSL